MKLGVAVFLALAVFFRAAVPDLLAGDGPALVITADLQFSYAEQLYGQGDYEAARVEFKRFVHFFPGDSRGDEARFKEALALYHSGQFMAAAEAFNWLILKQQEAGEKPLHSGEAYFMQSRAFMAMGNTGYAQVVLQNFLKLTEDREVLDRIYQELAMLHLMETRNLGMDELDQAERYLTLISAENRDSHQVPVKLEALDRVRNAPYKAPTLSGILAIIPGAGFLYCQRYKDAFVAFCLNTGLIYAAYTAFDNDNPALGGVITFVESGFYAGNIYGSVTAAHKYNKQEQVKLLDRAFQLGAGVDPINQSFLFTLNHLF